MASSRKPSMGSTYVTEKRVSQWEELMKKFSEAHKEQCKTVPLDIPRADRSTKYFPTGSQYEGSWDVLGMSGYGEYKFPTGVTYCGDFEDGLFHGKGELNYGEGIILRGKWVHGVMTERTLVFDDSLEYTEDKWKYCKMPDRRFSIEYDMDLMPAGKSYLTAVQPTIEIPVGYYDTGDGFYDHERKVVYDYKDLTAIIRSPSILEQEWIINNCRMNPEKPLGPRPDLYEKFSVPVLNPKPPPPPAAGVKSTMASFRTQSIFEQDFDFSRETSTFYDPTQGLSTHEMFYEKSLRNVNLDSAIQSESDVWHDHEIDEQSATAEVTSDQSAAAKLTSDQSAATEFATYNQSVVPELTSDQSVPSSNQS